MNTSKSLQLCSLLLVTSVTSLSAATVVVVNARIADYAGNDPGFDILDGSNSAHIGNQGFSPTGRVGFNLADGIGWTQGANFIPDFSTGSINYRFDPHGFVSGAVEGINYVRYDGQGDGVFEAVFKVSLTSTNSQSRILSYAYNEPTQNLSIPDAVSAINSVPEPSSTMLLGLGGLSLMLRRKAS